MEHVVPFPVETSATGAQLFNIHSSQILRRWRPIDESRYGIHRVLELHWFSRALHTNVFEDRVNSTKIEMRLLWRCFAPSRNLSKQLVPDFVACP